MRKRKGDGSMTVREMGALGGKANAACHDHEHFVKVGSRGGVRTKTLYGPEHYQRIGKLGGARLSFLVALGRAVESKTS